MSESITANATFPSKTNARFEIDGSGHDHDTESYIYVPSQSSQHHDGLDEAATGEGHPKKYWGKKSGSVLSATEDYVSEFVRTPEESLPDTEESLEDLCGHLTMSLIELANCLAEDQRGVEEEYMRMTHPSSPSERMAENEMTAEEAELYQQTALKNTMAGYRLVFDELLNIFDDIQGHKRDGFVEILELTMLKEGTNVMDLEEDMGLLRSMDDSLIEDLVTKMKDYVRDARKQQADVGLNCSNTHGTGVNSDSEHDHEPGVKDAASTTVEPSSSNELLFTAPTNEHFSTEKKYKASHDSENNEERPAMSESPSIPIASHNRYKRFVRSLLNLRILSMQALETILCLESAKIKEELIDALQHQMKEIALSKGSGPNEMPIHSLKTIQAKMSADEIRDLIVDELKAREVASAYRNRQQSGSMSTSSYETVLYLPEHPKQVKKEPIQERQTSSQDINSRSTQKSTRAPQELNPYCLSCGFWYNLEWLQRRATELNVKIFSPGYPKNSNNECQINRKRLCVACKLGARNMAATEDRDFISFRGRRRREKREEALKKLLESGIVTPMTSEDWVRLKERREREMARL